MNLRIKLEGITLLGPMSWTIGMDTSTRCRRMKIVVKDLMWHMLGVDTIERGVEWHGKG